MNFLQKHKFNNSIAELAFFTSAALLASIAVAALRYFDFLPAVLGGQLQVLLILAAYCMYERSYTVKALVFEPAKIWKALQAASVFSAGLILCNLLVCQLLVHLTSASAALKAVAPDDTATLLFLAIVAAPVLEELVFRGFLFRRLFAAGGSVVAYVGSATCFAAVHLDPSFFLAYFVAGLVLAYAYKATGRIWVSMIAHSANNLFVFLIAMGLL